jgi:O-antigen/teichoic acid export membrane protein
MRLWNGRLTFMQASPSPPDTSPTPELATEVGSASGASTDSGAAANQPAGLVRNTLYLTLAQAVTIPISVAANALAGRYLGSKDFGYMYLASTLCSFAVLPLEWGQQGSLPALVARDRANAATYLGTSLLWRALLTLPIAGALAVFCAAFGYETDVLWAVELSFMGSLLNSIAGGFKDTIRGFERTDIPSYAHVAQQVLYLLAIVPVFLLGGKLRALLLAYVFAGFVITVYLRRALSAIGVPRLEARRNALKQLFSGGTPFVFFGLAMVLQPIINALFLSKLAPAEVVGWYGVSQRLIGLLIFPASALIGALYPTLCRLYLEDREEFTRVTRGALYGVALLAIPATVGCGMFPELGVAIFGIEQYSGAVAHLQLMSAFVFLVYFSMPLGTALMAAERQKIWSAVQFICVAVSLVGNPLLIPWFQRRWANGGLGTCLTVVLSEFVVVACGVALCPRGLFDRGLAKSLLLAGLSGAAMAGVAYLTKPISMFLAVPLACLSYAGVAWFSGAVQPATIDKIKGFVNRKLKRNA